MFFFFAAALRRFGALRSHGRGSAVAVLVAPPCLCQTVVPYVGRLTKCGQVFLPFSTHTLFCVGVNCFFGAARGRFRFASVASFFVGGVSRVVFPVCFSFVCSAVFWLVVAGVVSRSCWRGGRGSRWSRFRLASVVVGRPRSRRRRRFVRRCLRRRPFAPVPSLPSSVVGSSLRLAAGSAVVGVVRLSPLVLLPLALCSGFVRSRLAPVGRLVVGRSGCCPSSVGRVVVRVGARALCSRWLPLVAVVRACRRGRRGNPAALFRERRNRK